MRTGTSCRRYDKPIPSDILRKLDICRNQAAHIPKRQIHCPQCGYLLVEVYGTDHHLTNLKCQRCKWTGVLDTAMFRTMRTGYTRMRRIPKKYPSR